MLKKTFYESLLKYSFNIPVKTVFWNGSSIIHDDGTPEVTITLNEEIPMRDITKNASIALGEAYMDEKVEIQDNIQELIESAYESAHSLIRSSKFYKSLPKQGHSGEESEDDVQSYYDVGNGPYKLRLDDTPIHSYAYPTDGNHDDFTEVQVDKVRHTLKKLNPKPDKILLDIGRGWGTLMLTATKEYGLRVIGVTSSEEQHRFVKGWIEKEGL